MYVVGNVNSAITRPIGTQLTGVGSARTGSTLTGQDTDGAYDNELAFGFPMTSVNNLHIPKSGTHNRHVFSPKPATNGEEELYDVAA